MNSFQDIWSLLNPQGEYKRRYRVCGRLWTSYSPDMQQRIFNAIGEAQRRGEPISPNPYFAIEDTAIRLQRKPGRQTLSFADYYARYGTTEEKDGWVRTLLPDQQKTIYIKN